LRCVGKSIRWDVFGNVAHDGGFGIVEEFAKAVVGVASICHGTIFFFKRRERIRKGYKILGELRNSFLMAKIGKDVSTRGHQTR
jgi:hypothetical protein